MAPKPLYNWLDWWNTRRSSWGSIREKGRVQSSWSNARAGAPASSSIPAANATSAGTAALVVNASISNDSPEQYISPQQYVSPEQYVVINDANPLLSAEAQSIWEQALASASRYLANLLSNPDRDQLLQEVFGKAGTDAATFGANLQALLNSLSSSGLRIEVDLRSDVELNGARAAYAAVGHTGSERIYVNGDKLNNGELDLTLTISALLEEFGHAIDRRLNGGVDSPGDEGHLFAAQVTGVVLTADQRALIDAEDDTAVLMIEGAQVGVECDTFGSMTSVTFSTDSGASGTDKITNTASQTLSFGYTFNQSGNSRFTFYADNGSGTRVNVGRPAAVTGTNASATGSFTATTPITLLNGTNTLTIYTAASGGTAVWTQSYTLDTTAPTLSITSSTAALRSGQTATITFTFSEDPGSTFTWNGSTGDVFVTGGTLGAISSSGLTRTATFTPTASLASGSASITVAAGSYTDTAGNNGGAGTTPSISIDTLAPTATVAITAVVSDTGSSSSDYITSDTTLEVNGSNGSLGSGEKVQISTDGSTWADVSVATATTWTYTDLTTRTSSLTYQVRVIDTAGNVGNTASRLVTIDTAAPTSSVGSQSVQLVEAGGTANGTAGTAAATITLTKADSLTTASFDTTYLTSNGWSTADSGVTYTKAGTYGTATFTIASGVVAYALNNSATATQALTANQPASDGFGTVQIVDTAGNTSLSSAIAFAITGTNDAPVGVNDSGSATEAGGTSNGTAGSNATGNVLTNDTDVDNTNVQLSVTAIRTGSTEGGGTAGTLGSALTGTYGSLTLTAAGSYTYVVNESNATVQALNSGGTLTDSFNYTFSDSSLTDIAVLNVTINGANDASIIDLNTSDASRPQTTTLTFNAAGYDVGDVVSVVVDSVTYSHTVAASATSAENVYDALRAVSVGGVTLANSLAADGVTWAADLTNSSVTLTSSAGTTNAFTLTSAVNNENDLGVGTYQIDWNNNLNGFFGLGAFSGNISINIFGTTYTSANATGSSGNTRFENVAPGLADQLTAAGYPTTYTSSANSFDITILSSSAVTTLSSSTSGGAYGGGTFSTVTPFVAPTDQAAPSVSTTTTAATASNNFQGTFTENGSPILLATGDNNLSDVDNTAFSNIKVAYTTANFADGSSEQLLINGATAGGTISGLGTLANGATGTLTLGGVTYVFSLVVAPETSTITFTGASGATLSTAQAEALVDAFQYNNNSHNPTAGSNRVFSVSPTDAGGLAGNTATFTATVVAVNDAPSITSSATASFAENGTGTVYTATASDPDNTTFTYSIAGTDAAIFNIDSFTGAVTFKSAPNFEAPADAGGNNVYDITVTASDGSLSSAARAVAITVTDVDDTPPNAPLITTVSDDVNPVTGVVANGGSTNDTVLLIAGTAEANSTIQLFNGATSIGSTTADGAGAWTFTTGTLANDTQYSFNATATDAAGNVSAASANYTISVDTGPPAAVTLTLGSGLSDGATASEAAAATGAVSVLAQAGTNVAVSFSRSQGGSVTKNLIGSAAAQAVVLSTADLVTLGDGVINVSAVASDGAGNSSDPATATFTLDTTAPQPLALALQVDTGSSSRDGITSNPQVLVSQLESDTVWEVSSNAGSSWTTGSVNSFSLAEGSYATNQVQVRQRDTAGNISTATGNSNAWLVDSTAPQFIAGSSATTTPILENSGSNRTIYTPPVAATEAATGGVLRYSLLSGGDASYFSVGTFSGTVTLLSNPDYEIKSSYAFTLRARDVAGNATDQMVSLQVLDVDEVAPNAPQIAVVGSDDKLSGAEASSSVVISGTAEAGSLVTVRWASNPARTATVTGDSWSVTYRASEIPTNGTSLISATAKDFAGNLSSAGSRSVLVDRIAPNRPLLNTVAGDNRINASEWASGIQLQGTAELGSSVTANLAGVIRSTTVDANGNWLLSYASAALPVDGLASLSVICTDLAGNVSTAATRLLQVDSQAPLTPTLQTVAGDNMINAAEAAAGIQLNGSAEAGSTVQALWGGIGVGSAVVSSAGLWAINVAGAALPANGSSTLQIASRDAAGNNSGSLSRAIELDRLAPTIPSINSVGNGDVVNAQAAESGVLVSGKAEAGSLVRVQWGDQIRSVNAGSDGTWEINYSSSQLPLNGQRTITATAIDALGNVSAAASRPVLIDTTPSTTLVTNLKLSADSGSSDSDFVTAEAVQLLSGTLSAALQTGETVQVSLDGGSQWISAHPGSSPLSFSAPVNLGSGDSTGTIQVVVVDAAGNPGAVRSQAYRLESGPNSNGIASLSIGPDSGVVGDLLTNVSQQTLRGTLVSPLQAGERIQFRSLQSNGSWSAWGTAVGSTNSIDFTFHSTFQEGENQLELRHLDIAGNASQTFSLAPQLDSAAPKVSSITLNGAGLDRAWQAGDIATIQVNFSESIRVSGIPSLTISLANQSKGCMYAGNSTNQLQFTYTISDNDLANGSPVIAIVPGSLDLSDVAISDAAGNIALSAITNQIIGSGSADLINGTSLNDVITGAAGRDQLSGGMGSDLFVFRSGSDSCLGSSTNGFDTITDFQLGSDQLQLGSLAPVSNFTSLGSISELSSSALSSLLNTTTFQAPGVGVQFSFGANIFLAVNNNNAGFSELEDLVVMIGN